MPTEVNITRSTEKLLKGKQMSFLSICTLRLLLSYLKSHFFFLQMTFLLPLPPISPRANRFTSKYYRIRGEIHNPLSPLNYYMIHETSHPTTTTTTHYTSTIYVGLYGIIDSRRFPYLGTFTATTRMYALGYRC
jgi:hypothetical protein